ncbi:MAG: DNA polymerase III subunit beta [Porticoccaceae bacterium]
MKFTASRETLLKPLQLVAGIVERRQTLPVLSNVLLVLNEQELSVTGTDLEVEIRSQVQLEAAGESGEITVPARKFVDICRSLPDGAEIKFSTEDGRAILRSGRSRFALSTLPANEFPSVEEQSGRMSFTVAQQKLKQLIDKTAFAMAQQDVRYYLNGMLWEVSGNRLRVVATDGHRLAMSDGDIQVNPNNVGGDKAEQSILPRKGVVELARLLSDEGEVSVVMGTNHARIEGEDFRFTSKLVDGAYPDYERVLPKGGTQILEGERDGLKQAFQRASILSNEKYRGVRMQLEGDQLTIMANNPEQETAEEKITVGYNGGTLELGFNVNYIIDVLNVLGGDKVRFTLSDANSSALMDDHSDDSSVYVIMPMRL